MNEKRNQPEEKKIITFSEEIPTPKDFTTGKFLKVLSQHGIEINVNKQQMAVYVKEFDEKIYYELFDEKMKALTNSSIEGEKSVPVSDRLAVIGSIICHDITNELTIDDLEKDSLPDFTLTPAATERLTMKMLEAMEARKKEIERNMKPVRKSVRKYRLERSIKAKWYAFLKRTLHVCPLEEYESLQRRHRELEELHKNRMLQYQNEIRKLKRSMPSRDEQMETRQILKEWNQIKDKWEKLKAAGLLDKMLQQIQ